MLTIRRKRIHAAFFVFPEYADTVPTLSVVSTLVRRGYRVSYVTTDRFARDIAELGAEFIRCPALSKEPADESPFHTLTAETLSAITPFYEQNRPDVVIHDTVSLPGWILANRWQTPAIQVSPDFKMDKRKPSRQAPEFFKAALSGAAGLEQVLARYGIHADAFLFSREKLNVYFYSKLFQLDDEVHDDGCFYAGRCAPERPVFEKWMSRDTDGRPVVLVSTSTLFAQGPEHFRMCIEALRDIRWHVILQIAENHIPAALGPLPEHFEVIQRKPQIAVLPYVDLLICAGGMMTTMEAIYCGVPLLMTTYGNTELEAYAENGVRLGVGRHLRKPETSASTIRDHVLQMSEDTSLFDRVQRMQRVIQAEAGAEEVANRIGEYFESSL